MTQEKFDLAVMGGGPGGYAAAIRAAHIVLATGARAMAPVEPDGRLAVGSGAIGIEFASFYRSLGAEVTVVEVRDRILPVEDAEISAFAHKAFERQGMKLLASSVVSLQKQADGIIAVIDTKGAKIEIRTERVIAAWCRSGEPGVYAIGYANSPHLPVGTVHGTTDGRKLCDAATAPVAKYRRH
ncbi:FAD-dependent oxidoreductase [Pollutimonas bauzanensis]|uniref:Dihydrolipoamide dehydrogenase n=1 Tax=Pollutimonas bauzanensis TaxID=658167 RepID=A0A1M5QH91_9BURK|nr:FAD-dependent oxidoreductase [Pollutimonas bauzanensis]SHH13246.1 Pyridine nucleotide-disulphide oxidoreductase [Pollutimonas bauzanensis]